MLTFLPFVESGISETIKKAISTGKNTSIETPYRSKWGNQFFLNFRVFPRKSENGDICGCHAIIEDLTAEKDASFEIEDNRLKDKLIAGISNRFINSSFRNIDRDVNRTLKDLGDFIGADHVVIFSFAEDANHIVKTHEWYVEGVTPKIPLNNKWDSTGLVLERLKKLEIINIFDVDRIPKKSEDIKKRLQELGIKSTAIVPFSHNGIFKGFIGVDSKRTARSWDEKQLYVLKVAGDMIANILERKYAEEKFLKIEALLTEVSRIAKIGGWEFDVSTGKGTWTPEIARIHELDPSAPTDLELGLSFYSPGSRELVEKAIHDAIEKAEPYDLELELITAKGTHKWVRTIGSPQIIDNKVVKVAGSFQDITELKIAEEELRRSEALLTDVGKITKIGGWELDVTSGETTWTPEIREIHELDNDVVLGVEVGLSFYTPESREIIEKAVNAAIEKAEPYDLELEFTTVKGNHKWVRISGRPKIVNGKVVKITGTMQDITKHKLAEEELKESEERFKALHNASFGGIAIHDRGIILECNQGLSEISGYSMEELIGMDGLLLIAEDSRDTVMTNILSGFEESYEVKGLRKDGTEYPLRLEARSIPYKGKSVRVVEFRDISEQKRAEEEMIRSETKYRSLFEQSNDAIMVHNFDGKIVDINKTACKMLGYTEDELKHKSILDLVAPEDREEVVRKLVDVHTNGHLRTETKIMRSDGSILIMDVNGSLIRTQEKLILVVGRDITDRIEAEKALLSAKIEAEAASRTKSQFLANMSHELRTPLNSIIGFSDVILNGVVGELDPRQEDYMHYISNSGNHLLTLINDILDISKIEAGKMDLHFEMFNVSTVVEEIVTMTEPLTSEKNLNLVLDLPERMPKIMADRSKFKQILYNLVGNAIKFTDNGGKITIHIETGDRLMRVSIIDTGIGISRENQSKLFKPFSQIDSSSSKKYEGTGLGLALVKEIVELHGGSIWVESEPGVGSNFTFEIPIDPIDRNDSD